MTTFRLKNDRLLDVALENEKVMARAGAIVAYDGSINFEKAVCQTPSRPQEYQQRIV